MRTSVAALAVIRRHRQGQPEYLASWNQAWGRFHFLGGHKHDHESFRQCLIREAGEELGLTLDRDFRLDDQPLAHLEYTAFSRSAQVETAYTIELFGMDLDNAEAPPRAPVLVRWLREGEIAAGRCHDGLPISDTMHLLLERGGLWASPPVHVLADPKTS
jgi:8-oxo-dGTP pyrophosphatase MutT (NUDIX family)